jgi:predicted permease
MTRIRFLIRNLIRRHTTERLLDDELKAALDIIANEKIARGVYPAEAYRQARLELGGVEQVKEEVRRSRLIAPLDSVVADVRYSARILRKNRAVTIIAVLSLALGIGANTAVFSVINGLLLKPLPVDDPQRLVLFRIPVQGQNGLSMGMSYQTFEQFRARSQSFSGIIAHADPGTRRMSDASGEEFEIVRADVVSANYFSVLGIHPLLGRIFEPASTAVEVETVISHAFWQRRFGSDPNVIGRTITLNDRPARIIAVTPRAFTGLQIDRSPDLWLPLEVVTGAQLKNARDALWLGLTARLAPGVTVDQARAEVDAIFRQLRSESAGPAPGAMSLAQRIELESGETGWTLLRSNFSRQLFILMGIASLLLLIGCSNVSSLLLARGASRRQEIAVRLAIGGGRIRVLRQLLTESATLSGLSAITGFVLAGWGTRVLLIYIPHDTGSALNTGFDTRVLLFTTAISILSTALFGIVPALTGTKVDLAPTLNGDVRGDSWLRPSGLNRLNVMFQVALSVVLQVGAGLFLRTLWNLQTFDAGFDRHSVVQFSLNPGPGFDRQQVISLHKQMLDRLVNLPGVSSVTFSANAMLSEATRTGGFGQIEGYQRGADEIISTQWVFVAPKFFETVGLRLARGRGITAGDESTRVLVINQAMARRYFADRNPIGKRLSRGGDSVYEVIGVAEDAKYHTLREDTPYVVYAPFSSEASPINSFSLRTTLDMGRLATAVRQIAKDVNPRIIIGELRTMAEVAGATIVQERLLGHLGALCSIVALLLACIGVFGVLSYYVTQRTREIGIRMALGARSEQVVAAVLHDTIITVVFGLILGLAGALAATHFISSLLFGISPTDPATIVTAFAVLLFAAALAAYVPARRAANIDPLVALRYE